MDALAFLERVKVSGDYRNQIAAVRCIDARPAAYRPPRNALRPEIARLLTENGIEQLYTHQADAIDAVSAGENVVICTGTASGKSLCYHVPVLTSLLAEPDTRALYLFPAKALAYDQLGALERLARTDEFAQTARPACYDGDTPTHKRSGIRRNANIILSNPDMLHQSILPYHAKWASYFASLKYVVLDEIHTYRGIFGSHVANVIRRLQRICRHYGADPQFICCSATLGNPKPLAESLTQRPFTLVDEDGSPRGRKWFVLWNPPWLDDGKITRRSANVEAQKLMHTLLESGAGTIAFAKARVVAELLYKYLTEALRQHRPDLASRIRPYRGGYLPNERRQIEADLFTGRLLGVCSTNALELGVDIGVLDAALLIGFPSTFCSLWQQAGRAGRRVDESLAIFIAYDDPVDQYLIRQPDFLFDRPVEHGIIDAENPHVLSAQLTCAACELPLESDDLNSFGLTAIPVAEALEEAGTLKTSAGRQHYAVSGLPHQKTSLRTISNATYAIVDITDNRNEVIAQVDSISAPELVYPEAVYLHQGASYIVRELDQQANLARVERLDADYYTQPLLQDACRIIQPREHADDHGLERHFGDLVVSWQTVGFRKFKFYTSELIGQTKQELPAQEINTAGTWLVPPRAALRAVADGGAKPYEALSGVRNMLLVALPTLAMCDRYDIGGIVNSSQLGFPAIFVYDRYEGGIGYARTGFQHAAEWLERAHQFVEQCRCETGCPACVGPPNLRVAIHHDPDAYRGYAIPDKAATLTLFENWRDSASAIPDEPA